MNGCQKKEAGAGQRKSLRWTNSGFPAQSFLPGIYIILLLVISGFFWLLLQRVPLTGRWGDGCADRVTIYKSKPRGMQPSNGCSETLSLPLITGKWFNDAHCVLEGSSHFPSCGNPESDTGVTLLWHQLSKWTQQPPTVLTWKSSKLMLR